MIPPTSENLENSLSKLKPQPEASQAPLLLQEDIRNIAWAFTFAPNQDKFLKEVHAANPMLAETLLVFRAMLAKAAHTPNLESTIDHLFLHYVINTEGPIPEGEGEDPFDVFDAATRYARTLCVQVSQGQNNDSILHLNGKDQLCPNWGTVPNWSAAWSLRQVGPVINRARYGRNDVIPSAAFGFDEHHESHNLQNAMTLADFSHMAYFEPGYIEEQLKNWGYTDFHWVENPDTDTQVFVTGKETHLIVCFRGTSSGKDALSDLNFFKTDAFGGRGRVHQGFQKALDSVWTSLDAAVDSIGAGKKIFLCGHSLGAALAQLAAHRFALNAREVANVYVYGSPRIGNREFKDAYNGLLEDKTFLHINHQDIVTQVPPQLFGFYHLGATPRQFDRNHGISMPDSPQEVVELEQRLEDLDASSREEIQQNMRKVQSAIEAATEFLDAAPQQFSGASYGTFFEEGSMDDHKMDQYLFKFGCAIVSAELERMKRED